MKRKKTIEPINDFGIAGAVVDTLHPIEELRLNPGL